MPSSIRRRTGRSRSRSPAKTGATPSVCRTLDAASPRRPNRTSSNVFTASSKDGLKHPGPGSVWLSLAGLRKSTPAVWNWSDQRRRAACSGRFCRGLRSLSRLEKLGQGRNLSFDFLSNLLALGVQLLLVHAFLVGEYDGQSADNLAGFVALGHLHLEVIARGVDFQVRLAGIDHAHVVFIGLLADTADIGSDDDVLFFARRRHMEGNDQQVRVLFHLAFHQTLRENLGLGTLGVEQRH